jgi:hypothetical protein
LRGDEGGTAEPVFIAVEEADTPLLPDYFSFPKLNRLRAVKKLIGEACQTLGISCSQTGVGLEKSVVGKEKKVTLYSQHCLYPEWNR